MEYLKLAIEDGWNCIRLIAANPFLVAVIAINALGGIIAWALKHR